MAGQAPAAFRASPSSHRRACRNHQRCHSLWSTTGCIPTLPSWYPPEPGLQ